MSLSDIKRKLYQKEEEKNLSEHDKSFYDPHNASRPQTNSAPDLWVDKKEFLEPKHKLAIKKGAYILGGIIVLIFILLAAYLIRLSSFSSDRVTVSITGSDRAGSGRFLTYEINYKNDNRIALKNAQIKVTFPSDFKPEDNEKFTQESPTDGTFSIGDIAGYASGKIIFSGRMYSPKGALVYIKSQLSYNPGSFSTRYISENQIGVNVTTSPLTLEIQSPQNISSGDEIGYLISYKNDGETDLRDIKIKIDYPDGFTFSTSDPKSFEGNNIWYLGTLSPGQSGKLIVNGKLEGEKDQAKTVHVYIGSTEKGNFISFNDSSTDTKIVGSAIAISQTVNGIDGLNANAGDELRFVVEYKNTSNIGLKNLVLTSKIDSPVLDYGSLNASGGHFDESSKTITWKGSDHAELRGLEAGQGGRVEFFIKIKDSIPVASSNDKNFVISSVVKIDSPDIPTPISMNKIISGNRIDVKLNSKLFLSVKGFHNDPNITNSGPIPPKAGQETTYTIHWAVSNINNDISNARVESILPTWATATKEFYPEGANITYNERDNSIVWEIGNMTAGTGVLSSPKEVTFQIKINPSPDQIGRVIEILKPSVFKARDVFTGQDISATTEGKTTQLSEDSSLGMNYKVE